MVLKAHSVEWEATGIQIPFFGCGLKQINSDSTSYFVCGPLVQKSPLTYRSVDWCTLRRYLTAGILTAAELDMMAQLVVDAGYVTKEDFTSVDDDFGVVERFEMICFDGVWKPDWMIVVTDDDGSCLSRSFMLAD